MTTHLDGGLTYWNGARESWNASPNWEMVRDLADHSEDVFRGVVGSEDTEAEGAHCFGECGGYEAENVVNKDFDICFMGGEPRKEVLVNGFAKAVA